MTCKLSYLKFLSGTLVLYFLLVLNSCNGQTTSFCPDSVKKYTREWANLGAGNSTDAIFNSLDGVTIGLNYHWRPKRITYLAGASHSGLLLSESTNLEVINGGIGKSIIKRRYLLSLVAGPAIMWGKVREDKFVKPGLSINGGIILKLIRGLGLGIELYSNINSSINATGARVVIHLNNDK